MVLFGFMYQKSICITLTLKKGDTPMPECITLKLCVNLKYNLCIFVIINFIVYGL